MVGGAAVFLVAWGYHRLSHLFGGDRRPLLIALTGFLVLLLASCGLEAMRFWSSKAALPMEPGGMLGYEVGRLVSCSSVTPAARWSCWCWA